MKGWNIGNKGNILYIYNGDKVIEFDRMLPGKNGVLMGVEMYPIVNDMPEVAMMKEGYNVNINDLHEMVSHVNEEVLRMTANYYGWKVNGQIYISARIVLKVKQSKRQLVRNIMKS